LLRITDTSVGGTNTLELVAGAIIICNIKHVVDQSEIWLIYGDYRTHKYTENSTVATTTNSTILCPIR